METTSSFLFRTRPYGFDRDDRGWRIWAGRLGRVHAHIWRARLYDGYRSFLRVTVGCGRAQANVSLVRYRPGAHLPWHRDAGFDVHHRAAIIQLRRAAHGGQFETRGRKPLWMSKRLFVFDGVNSEHRLTTVRGHDRWIIIAQATIPRIK